MKAILILLLLSVNGQEAVNAGIMSVKDCNAEAKAQVEQTQRLYPNSDDLLEHLEDNPKDKVVIAAACQTVRAPGIKT